MQCLLAFIGFEKKKQSELAFWNLSGFQKSNLSGSIE